ncbi:MAG: hypothetical protein IPO08_22195 [Xanthomonadales bacterium]|nr:hypothetical protein [Xanthomonadales bacterium]
MATTEKIDIWGPIVNSNLQLLEAMIAGAETIATTSGTVVLTTNNGAADQARKAFVICTGALIGNLILEIPNLSKHYLIYNRTTNAFSVTVKTNSGSAITVPQGSAAIVACDANDVVSFFAPPVIPATGALANAIAFSNFPTGTQGDVLYHNGTLWAKLGAGASGQALITAGTGANPAWGNPSAVSTKNALINGAMMVSQRRGTSSVSGDDIYLTDRWIGLTEDPVLTGWAQELSDVPAGSYAALGAASTFTPSKIGVCQIIEQRNCAHLVGGDVVLSFKAKVTDDARFATMKAAILSWDGAADTVTSDIVSAWNGAGTTPTFAANWTLENAPADLNVTESWASYSVTANIDTPSTKNIAVFIWSDDHEISATFGVTDVQLEAGTSPTAFERVGIQSEIDRCQRYYVPVTPIGEGGYASAGGQTGRMTTGIQFPATMRATPTIAFSSQVYGNGSGLNATSATDRGFFANATASAAGSCYWTANYTADAEL